MKLKLRHLPRALVGAVVVVVCTVILGLIIVFASLFTSSGRPGYVLARIWARIAARVLGITASLRGAEKVTPGASYIICPNHQGNADILALISTLPIPYRWVVKKELLKIPFFGWGLAGTGAVSLDRSNTKQAVETLRKGSDKLGGGWSLLIYPEGTRTRDGYVQPFKKGAFMMAVNTGFPILPVTVNGAFKILPKTALLPMPGQVTLTLSDPITTEGLTEEDVPKLMEKTREAVMKNLDPDYDPFRPAGPRIPAEPETTPVLGSEK